MTKPKHGPDSDCKGCAAVRSFADSHIGDDYYHCKVCQGWGWVQSCPGCGRLWGKFNPIKKRKKK